GQHEGWNSPFQLYFDRVDTLKPPLRLTVFIENHSKEGGIDQAVHANYILPSTKVVKGWRMRGGLEDPEKISVWLPLNQQTSAEGPCFFRSFFQASPAKQERAIYRVVTLGLGHGSVWVNGHNLGRYPEKIPVNGLYIPECWIKTGINSIFIYDEDGHSPK